jgi:hypothetical protein
MPPKASRNFEADWGWVGAIRWTRLPGQAPNTIRLGVLFLAQTVAFARQGIELAGSLLLLRAAH